MEMATSGPSPGCAPHTEQIGLDARTPPGVASAGRGEDMTVFGRSLALLITKKVKPTPARPAAATV